jgi:hypothetical protein
MKTGIAILVFVTLVTLPAPAQRQGNEWIPYSVDPHPSACNPELTSQASGRVHVNTFTSADTTGRLRFVAITNLKGKGSLSTDGTEVATYNVSQEDVYREIVMANPTFPVEFLETYRMNIAVKGSGANQLGNLYERYTLRYLVNASGDVVVSFEGDDVGCR